MVPIISADSIVRHVREKQALEVKQSDVRSVLKEDLGLSFRMTKKITVYCNLERCLVLRQ